MKAIKKSTVIQKIDIIPLDLKLKQPFVTALGRKTVTHNVLVILTLRGGITGYGEASSSLSIPSATQDVMARELAGLGQEIEGMNLPDAMSFIRSGVPEDIQPTSFSALEAALYDAEARSKGIGLFRLFGRKNVALETSLTVSAWPPEMARKWVRQHWKRGFRRFKIKVGTEWDEDLKRVVSVSEAAPRARLVLDGNQGFSVPGTIEFVKELAKRNIHPEFIEQPLPKGSSWEEWALVKEALPVPLALDESIANFEEAKETIRRGIVDIINIKLAKSGIGEALRIMSLAKEVGCRLMIGCMAESAAGLTASVHLACGTGAFDFVDLDSLYLLKPARRLSGGFAAEGPCLKVSSRIKGSGVNIRLNRSGIRAAERAALTGRV